MVLKISPTNVYAIFNRLVEKGLRAVSVECQHRFFLEVSFVTNVQYITKKCVASALLGDCLGEADCEG